MYNLDQIQHFLPQATHDAIDVTFVDNTTSTNTDLLHWAKTWSTTAPTKLWHALLTHEQTAGRGRQGKHFLTRPKSAIMLSFGWLTPLPLNQLIGWPLAVGLAIAKTLEQLNLPIQLKWPNDLWIHEQKLGGILVETQKTPFGIYVVSGIGINLNPVEHTLPYPTTALETHLDLNQLDLNLLISNLLTALHHACQTFTATGLQHVLDAWPKFDGLYGKEITVQEHDAIIQQGIAIGLDTQGCLLLQNQTGTYPILSGDVSIRRASNKPNS